MNTITINNDAKFSITYRFFDDTHETELSMNINGNNILAFNRNGKILTTCWNLDELANRFINSKSAEPQLFYIWGHSYEMDIGNISWEDFETFCEKISCLDDVFYGTNKQVLFEQ